MIPNKAVILLLLITLSIGGCNNKSTESKTLTEFADSDQRTFSGLYFYPSTIRMLAKMFGTKTGEGFSEIRGARVFFSLVDEDPTMVKNLFTELQSGIKEEGFEVLMQMKSPEADINVYLFDADIPDYVFFIRGIQGDMVAEINGTLSQESIQEIAQMDLTKAADLFDLIPEKVQTKSDSLQVVSPETSDNE